MLRESESENGREAEASQHQGMSARGRTIAGGVLYGTLSSVSLAAAIQWFFISSHPTILGAISLGLFVTLIPPWFGPLSGAAAAGAFLYWRPQRVRSFGWLVLEMSSLGAITALAVSQGLLPIAWPIPRLQIGVFSVLVGGGLAALGSWVLKPLYWPKGVHVGNRLGSSKG